MDWPSATPICSATVRAITSEVPPAANGTIMVIGRFGKSCANATVANDSAAIAASARFTTNEITRLFPDAR